MKNTNKEAPTSKTSLITGNYDFSFILVYKCIL